MAEEKNLQDNPVEEEDNIQGISMVKIRKLRNLKYFREWTDDQIVAWALERKKGEAPPENPNEVIVKELPASVKPETIPTIDEKEYDEKFRKYLARYRKEFAVDINDANDVESLRSLVRYVIQGELIDRAILVEQMKASPHPGTLKGLGDFQRTLQQNMNEIQDRLGISRKQRKDKQVDDIPQYIKSVQDKAKAFWERKTVAIKCEKCHIELARYWLNFTEVTKEDKDGNITTLPQKIRFELPCEKCKETVIFSG